MEVLNASKYRDLELVDSEEERTPLSTGEEQIGRGGSYSCLWPEDPEEMLTTGLGGTSSRTRLGRAVSLEVEAPVPRPTFVFLLEGVAQLKEFIPARISRVIRTNMS